MWTYCKKEIFVITSCILFKVYFIHYFHCSILICLLINYFTVNVFTFCHLMKGHANYFQHETVNESLRILKRNFKAFISSLCFKTGKWFIMYLKWIGLISYFHSNFGLEVLYSMGHIKQALLKIIAPCP